MTTDMNVVCQHSTRERRSVSSGIHRQAFTEYGFTSPQARGAFEVDHLIPLAQPVSFERGGEECTPGPALGSARIAVARGVGEAPDVAPGEALWEVAGRVVSLAAEQAPTRRSSGLFKAAAYSGRGELQLRERWGRAAESPQAGSRTRPTQE